MQQHNLMEIQSEEFSEIIQTLVSKYGVENIVETGTFLGTGSTLALAKTGLPVVTLECVKKNYETARKNLSPYPNVQVWHAHSLPMDAMLESIVATSSREYPPEIQNDANRPFFDHATYYMCEINHEVERDDALRGLIDNDDRQLLFLDSSGGVGEGEIRLVMELCMGKPKVVVMDDVNHIKHHYSLTLLREKGLDVQVSDNGRWAWTWMGEEHE